MSPVITVSLSQSEEDTWKFINASDAEHDAELMVAGNKTGHFVNYKQRMHVL